MAIINPSRAARLSASIEKAFGELFTFEPYKPTDDVNGRRVPDTSRILFVAKGVWHGPATSKTPTARGAASDDRAQNWTASLPSVNIQDASLTWTVQPGDKVTRMLDGATYAANASYADGFGRTTIPLTARKRGWAPPDVRALRFNDARNSQYLPLI